MAIRKLSSPSASSSPTGVGVKNADELPAGMTMDAGNEPLVTLGPRMQSVRDESAVNRLALVQHRLPRRHVVDHQQAVLLSDLTTSLLIEITRVTRRGWPDWSAPGVCADHRPAAVRTVP